MKPEIKKLDDKLIELSKNLFEIKANLDLYKILRINAPEIGAIGRGKYFFAHMRKLCLDSYILGICKVFEIEKDRELNSLPSILKTVKHYKPQNERPLLDFINEHRDLLGEQKEITENNLLADVGKIYDMFCRKYFVDDKIKKVRDKVVAHSEYMEDVMRPKDIQSYDLLEKFLFFAIDIYSAIHRAYGIVPHPLKNDKSVVSSMCGVLEKLGVNNIKIKFEDE
jgi:hypothetical protein